MKDEKEISIFDYLPKILPILDLIFIVWIACNSPAPWITTPIHLAMPIFGFSSLVLFRNKGRLGFYLVGTLTSIPQLFLNHWCSAQCPTWLTEINFIAGGMLMTSGLADRFVVLVYVYFTTLPSLLTSAADTNTICTIMISLTAFWFMMERSVAFMNKQKELIRKQKEIVEEKQKEILDSIYYAKRIQQSLLPSEKSIKRNLDKHT